MRRAIAGTRAGQRGRVRFKVAGLYVVLIAANLLAWGWALLAFRHYPVLLGTAFLAYGFGLRHAVDADHIAAVDNVIRKLRQTGQRPATVGLYFLLVIGGIELLGLIGDNLSLRGPAWDTVARLSDHLGVLGTIAVATLAFIWLGAPLLARSRYERPTRV